MSRFTDPQADTGKDRAIGVPGYFFREAFRRLWRSKRTTGVAISMIAISLVTLGFFLLISENLNHAVDQWEGGSQLRVYLKTDADSAAGANWYWYERVPATSEAPHDAYGVVADSKGGSGPA